MNRICRRFQHQPVAQLRPAPAACDIAHGDGDRLLLTDQHDQPFAARHAGVQQVPLQHGVMLGQERDDDRRIFRTLALVDGGGIGGDQHVEFAESIGNWPAVSKLAVISPASGSTWSI